jgi:hypothetical protein
MFKIVKKPVMLAFSGEYPSIMFNEMDNGLPGTQYIQNVAAPSCECPSSGPFMAHSVSLVA